MKVNRLCLLLCASVTLVTLVCGDTLQAWAAPAATTTTLAVSSGGVAVTMLTSGSGVTLTATVTAGVATVAAGQVRFCDASATYCTDIHILGTAQLTSSGTAVLKFIPGIGSHSYKAVFVGTTSDATSASSAAPLTVTGPSKYPTTTTITQSRSGSSYTLTATVAAYVSTTGLPLPTGNISFLDTTNGNAVLGTAHLGSGTTGRVFLNSTNTDLGSEPSSVAVGDFNGDGIPDLAVANSNTVSILLGQGNGTFIEAVNSPVPTDFGAGSVAVADFNGDGKLDLAVATDGSTSNNVNYVDILLGNGDGTFTQAPSNTVGFAPYSVAVGDFNGDGLPDLAVANYLSNSVTILLGNGNGTFMQATNSPVTVGAFPDCVVAGDFNGDGILDLAIANYGDATLTILLGNGNGTFTQAANSPVMVYGSISSISVGDFNGDGKPDLALANVSNANVIILLGNGNGTFSQGPNSPVPVGLHPNSVAVGDFNGDGIADLAVANSGGDTVTILLGNGSGAFSQASNSPVAVGSMPNSIATGDFNGDGNPDLAVANANDGTVTVMLSLLSETVGATASGISPSGAVLVEASYSGDSNYDSSTSSTTPLSGQHVTPAVTVTPSSSTISTVQGVNVTISVSGSPTPTGTVILSAGSYATSATTLVNGSAILAIPSGSLATGIYTLAVTYTPDPSSASTYNTATGSSLITIIPAAKITPTVDVIPSSFNITTTQPLYIETLVFGHNQDPTGTVTLISGSYTSAPTPVGVGISIPAGSLAVGTDTLTAIYSGDNNYTSAPGAATVSVKIGTIIPGTITTLAGDAIAGYSGDNGLATSAELHNPVGATMDSAGNLYIADTGNQRIRKLTPSGIIVTVAGNGTAGYSGDNGLATSAELDYPRGVAVDGSGNLYIADSGNERIRKVSSGGTITTVAGIGYIGLPGVGGYSGDNGPATSAQLNSPSALVVDTSGNIYIADWLNSRIRKVDRNGIITTVAGGGSNFGENEPAVGEYLAPVGVAIDSFGNLYIADATNGSFVSQCDCRIRKVNTSGMISTVAGNGGGGFYTGDNGAAISADLSPLNVSLDFAGNIYFADSHNVVRRVSTNGTITTVAGTGISGATGDNGSAINAELSSPTGVVVDSSGSLYIADNGNSRIRKVSFVASAPTPTISGLSPTSVTAGGAAFTLTINGTNFNSSATALWGNTALATTYVNAGQLTAIVPANLIAAAGTANVAVTTSGGVSPAATLTVTQAAQTINFTAPTSPVTYGVSPITLVASGGASGNAVVFSVLSGPGTVIGNMLTVTGVGTIQIAANQAGNANYLAAAQVTQSIVVNVIGAATPPVFSPAAGTYSSAQTVTISDTTPGATIYYTTNGTTPTASSSAYSGAISVSVTETLEAIATANGYSTSAVATAAYTMANPVPVVGSLSSVVGTAGGSGFALTISGAGFTASSTVYWSSSTLSTQFVSPTQLTSQVPASDIASAGTFAVTVQSPAPGGGISNPLQFVVNTSGLGSTVPVITTLTATVKAGSSTTYPVTVPANATNVSLSCLDLPAGATCSYSAATGLLTITTSATTPTGTYQIPVVFTETLPGAAGAGLFLPILLLPLIFARKRVAPRGVWLTASLGLLLMLSAAAMIGCGGGGGSNSTTTPATHSVTGAVSVSLTVQ